jgi:hypothetical protein
VASTPPAPTTETTCTANLVSVPPGAEVAFDNGSAIAHTPATIDVPCGKKVKVVFRKESMFAQARFVTGGDTPADVRMTLVHLPFTVKISSTPAGAAITIDGKVVGVTPTALKLPAFETSTLVFTKDGYDPVTEKVTAKTQSFSVRASLKKKAR